MERRIFLALAAGLALLPRLFSKESGSAVAKGIDVDLCVPKTQTRT
jgi:hypothetical protein